MKKWMQNPRTRLRVLGIPAVFVGVGIAAPLGYRECGSVTITVIAMSLVAIMGLAMLWLIPKYMLPPEEESERSSNAD